MDIDEHRKIEHIFIAEKLYNKESENNLNEIQLIFNDIPEIDINNISTKTKLMGHTIYNPFFINAITGGTPETDKINFKLAKIANQCKIPFATGSASIALKKNHREKLKKLRNLTKDTLLITNLSANSSLENIFKILELTKADGIQLHLNAPQEIIMMEGDREFYWQKNIKNALSNLNKPLMIKGIGQGVSPLTLNVLKKIGIKYVDLAGKGGTNFIKIENERLNNRHDYSYLANMGLSLTQCLIASIPFRNDFSITASGGIRNALDIVKSLIMGADNVGISGLFLHILIKEGTEQLIDKINILKEEVRNIMAILGCHNIQELHNVKYIMSANLNNFKNQIKNI